MRETRAGWPTGWLHIPKVERVYYPGRSRSIRMPKHSRVCFQPDLFGAMVSFDLKDAGKTDIFACMDRLKMIVRGTSLGDVHTLALYPAISSHRDIPPKQRARLGIGDGLLRLSIGIEAVDDIIADLDQAIG